MARILFSIMLALTATACSEKSTDGTVDRRHPTIKAPRNINADAEWAKVDKIRWTTPYPSTCIRSPITEKILRVEKIKGNPADFEVLGLRFPEFIDLIDACEVEFSTEKGAHTIQRRYMIWSSEWPGAVAYFKSLGLEHRMFFQNPNECDFDCQSYAPSPRNIHYVVQGQMQADCKRTDIALSVEQPIPNSRQGEVVLDTTTGVHRGSGGLDANGCSDWQGHL